MNKELEEAINRVLEAFHPSDVNAEQWQALSNLRNTMLITLYGGKS